ncbi:hypothetical protein [Kitasatospora sp. MBT66]|uniref:hypothetical protein n=1 Tax=Kitasatospora sp. MBT66 TaxID=1444769 RepID=UPI00068B138B|nr:hypothetical protein [Kitasatospora sp. MBT66]
MTDSARRTARTAFATVLGIAAALPLLVQTAGLPSALPGLGTLLTVAAAITRLMALPVVNSWLPGWLQMTAPKAALPGPRDADPSSRGGL